MSKYLFLKRTANHSCYCFPKKSTKQSTDKTNNQKSKKNNLTNKKKQSTINQKQNKQNIKYGINKLKKNDKNKMEQTKWKQ